MCPALCRAWLTYVWPLGAASLLGGAGACKAAECICRGAAQTQADSGPKESGPSTAQACRAPSLPQPHPVFHPTGCSVLPFIACLSLLLPNRQDYDQTQANMIPTAACYMYRVSQSCSFVEYVESSLTSWCPAECLCDLQLRWQQPYCQHVQQAPVCLSTQHLQH